jgi:Transglycosylase
MSVAVLVVAVPLLALGAAWFATPGVADLSRRVVLRPRGERGHVVGLGSVTPLTVDALVATEDERFRRNSGIDVVLVALTGVCLLGAGLVAAVRSFRVV